MHVIIWKIKPFILFPGVVEKVTLKEEDEQWNER